MDTLSVLTHQIANHLKSKHVVVVVDTTKYLGYVDYFKNLLSTQELKIYLSYKNHHVKNRFVIVRSILKLILCDVLNCDIEALHFEKNNYGKPFLKDFPIYFNLSHSGEYCLIGLSMVSDLGIDIEYKNINHNFKSIITRYFLTPEKEFIFSKPDTDIIDLFYSAWTAKEAICKALGLGLWSVIKLLRVPILDEKFKTTVDIPHHNIYKKDFEVHRLKLIENYYSCVAVNNSELGITQVNV